MKSTGIVRKVDELGRIVLPIELRRNLDIMERDALEIYVDGELLFCVSTSPPVSSAEIPRTWSATEARTSARTVFGT